MKGYYTVRVEAQGCSQSDRMVLETGYARELEAILGGSGQATNLCLIAAAEHEGGHSRTVLREASEMAEALVRSKRQVPAGCRFSINAWRAEDL
jgi:hypothetical protein